MKLLIIFYVARLISFLHCSENDIEKLKVFAVSTRESDGLRRFLRSGLMFNYDIKTVGIGWNTSTAMVSIINTELQSVCFEDALASGVVYMVINAEDTILVGPPAEVISSFKNMGSKIIFGADRVSSPRLQLASAYPLQDNNEYLYLCSDVFIGFSNTICELFATDIPQEVSDDQLFFTQLYLNSDMKSKYNIELDGRAEIFQNMHGGSEDVFIKYVGSHSILLNNRFLTSPKVAFANGAKVELNRLADYVPDRWLPSFGCQFCSEDRVSLDELDPNQWPLVVMAIFIKEPTPFLQSMLRRLAKINYPINRIILAVHNNVPYHEQVVNAFLSSPISTQYFSVELVVGETSVEGDIRNIILDMCIKTACKYIFELDSIAHIDNADTLKLLIEQNRPIISPMLRRPSEVWSNFWGAVTTTGYYSRSNDYIDIVTGLKRGLWNVPCTSIAILIRFDSIDNVRDAWLSSGDIETSIAFCTFMREKGNFMYVDNQHVYGHLVNPSNYDVVNRYHPELYELNFNRLDWEESYINPSYWQIGGKKDDRTFESASNYETKCPAVYMYPLFSETFCIHLIQEIELSGKAFSDDSGPAEHETVPSVDISMHKISFHKEWLQILKIYISPLAKYSFYGYEPESRANMAFVVRYNPSKQKDFRGQFDTATWTAAISLSRPGVDFEGGGTHFLRLNCSLADLPRGSVIIFPGRLSHYYENLPVVKGVRFLSVTYADP